MTPLTEATIREPLRAVLAARVVMRAPPASGTASAVLVPLFERNGEAHVWLMLRAEGLRKHGGQVAFPGGKTDPGDASGRDAGVREAYEEIGLPEASIDVLGQLDDLVSGTGFTISPFVAWVTDAFTPTPNPTEVAKVFAAPLRTFFEHPRGLAPFQGHAVEGQFVWGATAKILRDLVQLLRRNR
jgi:8-oxo-dGTP pyrophosphatase MutT (NUDIX family)